MSIATDTTTNSGYKTASASYNWAHSCGGDNRLLIVGVAMLSVLGSSVTGVTYAGVAMQFVGAKSSVSGAIRVEMWQISNPATGSNSVSVTLSTGLDSASTAVSFTDTDQITPTNGFASNSQTNVGLPNDATVSVTTTVDNSWVIDVGASDDTSISAGAGQSAMSNISGGLGTGEMSVKGPITPAGATNMIVTSLGNLATASNAALAVRPRVFSMPVVHGFIVGGSLVR